jgi:hypothetical protein
MNILPSMATVRRAMISKCSAAVLVLFIVLPFTPPFSTCGLSDLIGEVAMDHALASAGKVTQETATAVAITWSVVPVSLSAVVLSPVLTGVASPREIRPAPLRL